MRSSPTNNNNTLLRIQQEISEVAARENELRSLYQRQHSETSETNDPANMQDHVTKNGDTNIVDNCIENRSPSPISPTTSPIPPIVTTSKTLSAMINTNSIRTTTTTSQVSVTNGTNTRRLFIPNTNSSTKGVMQKFFKSRGKIATVAALNNNYQQSAVRSNINNAVAWQQPSNHEVSDQPAKALIPADKPLRKGYVPVEEKIEKELREFKQREEELRTFRRKSQPDLMAALEQENSLESSANSQSNSRSSSPIPFPGRLRNSRSYSQLLEDDFNYTEETNSMPNSLRPARSLAELCDISDEEVIEKPKNLIQQWESRIRQSQQTD